MEKLASQVNPSVWSWNLLAFGYCWITTTTRHTLNGSYVGGLYSIILRNNVVYVTFTDSIQAKDPVIVINI